MCPFSYQQSAHNFSPPARYTHKHEIFFTSTFFHQKNITYHLTRTPSLFLTQRGTRFDIPTWSSFRLFVRYAEPFLLLQVIVQKNKNLFLSGFGSLCSNACCLTGYPSLSRIYEVNGSEHSVVGAAGECGEWNRAHSTRVEGWKYVVHMLSAKN